MHLIEDFKVSDADLLKFDNAPEVASEEIEAEETEEITEVSPEIMTINQAIITEADEKEVAIESTMEAVETDSVDTVLEAPTTNEMATEIIENPISDAETVASPEYVEQVKDELSAERPGGFRFFMKRKFMLTIGIGSVGVISLFALFATGIFSTMSNPGKVNVSEIKPPDVPNTPLPPPPAPTTEPSTPNSSPETSTGTNDSLSGSTVSEVPTGSYEEGRDYTVTKNRKQNKKANQDESELTGSGTPAITPEQ